MRPGTLIAFAVGGAAAIVVSLFFVSLVDQSVSYPTMIALLAVLLVGALVREMIVFRDPLTPAGIVAITGILLFVLRPLTIMSSEVTSPGARADSRYFSDELVLAGSSALVQCLIFFAAFFLIYYAVAGRREFPIDGAVVPRRVVDSRGLQAVVFLTTLVALGAIGYLVLSSGGVGSYFSGLANRSEFLSGKSFLALTYVPVQIALVANVMHRRAVGLPVWNNWINLVAVGSLVLCGFTAGGRGPLIVGVVLPLLLLKQLGPKPFTLRTIMTMGVGLVIVAITYSVVVRNAAFDGGRSIDELQSDPVGVMLSQLTSGAETRPFDSLIRLNEAADDESFEFQLGSTYATVPAWFIPRALWDDKPSGGGNTWFTSTYVPRFYGTERVETSLSAIGEGYSNFGYAGVAVAGAAFGFLAGALKRRHLARRGLLGATLTVSLTPILFSLIRGDAYQGGSLTIATVILASGIYLIVSKKDPGTGPAAPKPENPAGEAGAAALAAEQAGHPVDVAAAGGQEAPPERPSVLR